MYSSKKKRLSIARMVVTAFVSWAGTVAATPNPPSPEWTKDLVIYEIATKAFTSPRGPESGTFESLRAKLPYLQDLGITGIWLSGHSLADPRHFLNIWSQYAVIEPDRIDPTLGTEEQFKSLIEDAHRRGIKIFLDVITHGVMSYSALVKNHPDWFLGQGWGGMTEYDWFGGRTDLDDWWVALWSDYVSKYGVDGYRLDLGTTRPDLWARIRQNAARNGHPIVIFEESNTAVAGVTDFGQVDNWVSDGNESNEILLTNVPAFYAAKFGRDNRFSVELSTADGEKLAGRVGAAGTLEVGFDGLTTDTVSQRRLSRFAPDGIPDVQLTVRGVPDRDLNRVTVTYQGGSDDRVISPPFSWTAELDRLATDGTFHAIGPVSAGGRAPILRLAVPTLTRGNSIMLSCHDNGQVGFPSGKSPYSAQGSRALFGYSFLFTPMLPIFMSGEEFDAGFRALPTLSPDFYGGRDPGQGRWLYGSMLDWDELKNAAHRSMLDDVKRMLRLRRQEDGLLTPELRGDIEPKLRAVDHDSNIPVPAPYVRWDEHAAIVVMANRNTTTDAQLKLTIPLDKMGMDGVHRFSVDDLWNGGPAKIYSSAALSALTYTVKRDKTRRGGIGLIKITPVPPDTQ